MTDHIIYSLLSFDHQTDHISSCAIGVSGTTVSGLRARLYGEKLSRVEGSPAYPNYPGRANFSYISSQNLANLASVAHFKRNIKKVADISDSHTAIM